MNSETRYRVVEWATGQVGRQALKCILEHPRLDLAGVWVSSAAKEGRDAGELCGTDPVGVAATRDVDALLAREVDCVCYTATDTLREEAVVEDLCRILRSGVNVVSTSYATLVEPSLLPAVAAELEAACAEGRSSLHVCGINPGFTLDFLPGVVSTLTTPVAAVELFEMFNVTAYNDPFILEQVLGFGLTPEQYEERKEFTQAGVYKIVSPAMALLADLLGVHLDSVEWSVDTVAAEKPLELGSMEVGEGGVRGAHVQFRGMSGGRQRITLNEYLCVGPEYGEWPDSWPQPPGGRGGYRIQLQSSLPIRVDVSFPGGESAVMEAITATAARAVNLIPAVCEAAPGVHRFLTLPHVFGSVDS
jgi:4-hydroxy-tetrahydrodipicolinate reductase